jgi:co-chaperonin GroES (HSP10)
MEEIIMESKYLNRFKNVEGKFKLNGSRLLVEVLPKREIKSAGGLVLSSPETHKATADSYRAVLATVLMLGEGYINDDNEDVPMETKVGDIILINEFGMRYYSEFPGLTEYTRNTLAVTNESEIQLRFKGISDYEKFEALLNNRVESANDSNNNS